VLGSEAVGEVYGLFQGADQDDGGILRDRLTRDAGCRERGELAIDFGGNDDVCSGIVVQADGKIVVSGTTTPPAGTNTSVRTLVPATLSPETVTITVATTP